MKCKIKLENFFSRYLYKRNLKAIIHGSINTENTKTH